MFLDHLDRQTETYADLLEVARRSCPEAPQVPINPGEVSDQEAIVRELGFYMAALIDEGIIELERGPGGKERCFRVEGTCYRVTEEGSLEVWGKGLYNGLLTALEHGQFFAGLFAILPGAVMLASAFSDAFWIGVIVQLLGILLILSYTHDIFPLSDLIASRWHDGWHSWDGRKNRDALAGHLAATLERGLADMRIRQSSEPEQFVRGLPRRLAALGARSAE